MNLRQKFKASLGNALFLERENEAGLEAYLREKSWLAQGEEILLMEKPGEGNMNFVTRVKTPLQSLIVKQARPWVEKFPQIDAPLERIQVESDFYSLIQHNAFLASFTPRLLGWDEDNFIMILEDLGNGTDLSRIYQKGESIAAEELEALTSFISHLHNQDFVEGKKTAFPSNQALKELNHEHIFYFPYLLDNGFDLNTIQPGLQELAQSYKKDEAFQEKIGVIGALYLGSGPVLIHGDFYPGSWLKVADGVRIIDPEFGFFGLPEFDLGVMVAHLHMAQTPKTLVDQVLAAYQAPSIFDIQLRKAFTGVEIIRRIIGLAQIPLELSLDEKKNLLEEARGLVENYQL